MVKKLFKRQKKTFLKNSRTRPASLDITFILASPHYPLININVSSINGEKLEHNAIKTVQYETLYTYFLVMITFSFQLSIRVIRILRKINSTEVGYD